MFERLLLSTVIAATGLPVVACDASEAAPSLPGPVRRDGGPPVDAGVPIDARVVDGGMLDAGRPDAGVRRRRSPRIIVDAGVPDAGVPDDAGVLDAAPADAAVGDARVLDPPIDAAPPIDAFDVMRDSGEAPPLYDARLLNAP